MAPAAKFEDFRDPHVIPLPNLLRIFLPRATLNASSRHPGSHQTFTQPGTATPGTTHHQQHPECQRISLSRVSRDHPRVIVNVASVVSSSLRRARRCGLPRPTLVSEGWTRVYGVVVALPDNDATIRVEFVRDDRR
jgi:hypothetical protein